MTVEQMVAGLKGQRSGKGWMTRCPAHDDRTPSLSIAVGKNGAPLVKCFAGCDQDVVIAAIRDLGLWPEYAARSDGDWVEWRDGIRYHTDWGSPVCAYEYTDAAGRLLYKVVRFLLPDGKKEFKPGYYEGGRWRWKKHANQVLYHLPEVLEAPIVFVTEGEKDCDTLRSHAFAATTNAGGAMAPWLPQYTDALRGREVILIPDRDLPGRERVIRIAKALVGNVARVALLELEDGKDVTEWFERGHSEVELIAELEKSEVGQ